MAFLEAYLRVLLRLNDVIRCPQSAAHHKKIITEGYERQFDLVRTLQIGRREALHYLEKSSFSRSSIEISGAPIVSTRVAIVVGSVDDDPPLPERLV
jgi:hypothetical protein